MAQSSKNVAMKIFLIAFLFVCGTSGDAKTDGKPTVGSVPSTAARRANAQQDPSSLPNVSGDVLDRMLNDRRFVQRQIKCATGEGQCDAIGRKIKAHAPLVMRGMCVKCSQAEIKQIQHVMSHIQKNYPKEYAKMLKQYQSGF